MSASNVSITRILLLSAMLSGCGENLEKEESTVNSSTETSQANQSDLSDGKNTQEAIKSANDKTMELGLSNDMQELNSDKSKLLTLKGQILFQEFEGGFFGFIDENGNKYTPIGMDKKYLRHGLVIELSGRILPDMITTTQFGESIKVESVSIIDESNAAEPGRPELHKKDI
jgi:hypothetical protein